MSAYNYLLDSYDRSSLLLLSVFAVMGSYVAGVIVDRVMLKRGFGQFGNAILVLMGAGIGLSISYSQLGPLQPSESDRIVATTTASSVLVLLVCGVLKSFIMEEA